MGRSVTTKIVSTVAGRTGDVNIAVADVSGAAPLASPVLSGVPKAPTAALGTSTEQIATTEFVSRVAMSAGSVALTNAAPSSESVGVASSVGSSSAAARSDHVHAMPGIATTLAAGFLSAADKTKLDGLETGAQVNDVTSVAGRTGAVTLAVADVSGAAPLASPALTGTPTAPTAAEGTNSTQVATTAFVKAAVASNITNVAPSAETVGAAASTGSSAAAARSDHVHAMPGTATGSAAGFMSAADKSKLDNVASSAAALGTSAGSALGTASAGSATTAAKSDHVHPLPTLAALGAASSSHTHVISNLTDWPAAVSATEVGYLSNVTSDIQAQLNGKAASSHTHDLSQSSVNYANSAGQVAWANVTSKPSQIISANSPGIGASVDWNTYLNAGVYNVGAADWIRSQNAPSLAYNFGTLVVTHDGGKAISQLYIPHQGGAAVRAKWNDDDWGPWRYLVDNLNIDTYAPTRLLRSDGNDPYYIQHKWDGVQWRIDGYKPDGSVHTGVVVSRADSAGSVDSVPWTSVTGKPSTYPPAGHTHDYAATNHTHDYAASSHTHDYAPNASPAFTGNPTSPTPNQFDKDTSIATTAFVQRALGNLQGSMILNAPKYLTWADCGKLVLLGQTQQVSGAIFLPGIIVTDGSDESEDGRTFYIYNASSNSEYVLDCGDIWLHGSPYVWTTHTETIKPGEYWTITAARGHYYATVTYDGPSLGIRQTWQVFSAFERVSGVTYENTSGSPISVMLTCPQQYNGDTTSPYVKVTVDDTVIADNLYAYGSFGQCLFSFVVPKGAKYKAEIIGINYGFSRWAELR